MRRADRLLLLIQALRRRSGPVTAQALAGELEVSRRTIYRDVLDLQAARVPIEGEAGVGYVLRPGYDLPPLMFTVEEVEAIALGARLARERAATGGDADLVRAADDVLAKVAAVLPAPLAAALGRSALLVPSRAPGRAEGSPGSSMAVLRRAVRDRARLRIGYVDAEGRETGRVVWPLALLFLADATLLGAWCELRRDFRFFRADRIRGLEATGQRFDARGGALVRDLMTRHEGAAP
jgi:predicted DNA-binding transcriptional regulator YafY